MIDLPGMRKHWAVLAMDERGKLRGAPPDRPAKVCLDLPPGMVILRRWGRPGLDAQGLNAGLQLWAEQSLPGDLTGFYLDHWPISAAELGLAALPRAPLAAAREALAERGAQIARIRVPELRPPLERRRTLVLWHGPHTLLASLWEAGNLLDWHCLAGGMDGSARAEVLAGLWSPPPACLIQFGIPSNGDLAGHLRQAWPDCELLAGEADSTLTELPFNRFDAFLNELAERPPSLGVKARLIAAGLAAALGGFLLFWGETVRLEREVEALTAQTSALKVRANRSEQVATRISELTQEVQGLRGLTVERAGILQALRAIGVGQPPRVRLDRLGIERSGAVVIDGVTEEEEELLRFLDGLGRSPLLIGPRLAFSQPEQATGAPGGKPLLRFRIEARLKEPLLIHAPKEEML